MSPGAPPRRTTLEVNRPLKIGSTSVYLIGHGYAPKVTVRDATGAVAFSGRGATGREAHRWWASGNHPSDSS